MTSPTPPSPEQNLVRVLTMPIVGLRNRTPDEVFDIMCDRIRRALTKSHSTDRTES